MVADDFMAVTAVVIMIVKRWNIERDQATATEAAKYGEQKAVSPCLTPLMFFNVCLARVTTELATYSDWSGWPVTLFVG